ARGAEDAARMVSATLDAVPDAILEVDGERIVVRANAAARSLLSASPGMTLLSIVRDPDILAGVEDVLAGRETADIPFTLPGPVERHLVVHVLRLDLGAAARSRAMLLYRDVTALRNADRLRADFVANVSHELRTPLASLSGFIETLRGPARDDEPARLRFLEIMEGEARRMTRLVSDLLSLSRIEASEHAVPTDPVDVLPIVARVVDALAPVARARRISIAVDIAAGLPAIPGDADQLQQVLQNLVDNAIKYGRADSEIRIGARLVAGEGGIPPRVAVAVADAGDGIPREHLHRLTERFYRVDPGRSRRMGGTGLGLAIVKHIVNRHRGTLSIESVPGEGSVFTVRFPALAAADPARAPHADQRVQSSSTA
ncbi:MAG: hypothetical protein RLZZ276_4012, partial [Pseudomonadota bacterium]